MKYLPSRTVRECIKIFEDRCEQMRRDGRDPLDTKWFYTEAAFIRRISSDDEREQKDNNLIRFYFNTISIGFAVAALIFLASLFLSSCASYDDAYFNQCREKCFPKMMRVGAMGCECWEKNE